MPKLQDLTTFDHVRDNSEDLDLEEFIELHDYIEKQRKFGKVPLFIIGAGVSYGKVTTMDGIFKKLEKLLEDFMKDNESNSQNKNDKKVRLARYALKLLDVVRSENARLAQTSYFFSILQEELREEVWNKFTEDFIKNPKLDDSPNPTPIWELEPTEFHMYIAEQVVNCKPPAIAASLNYDGLTARAIQKKP